MLMYSERSMLSHSKIENARLSTALVATVFIAAACSGGGYDNTSPQVPPPPPPLGSGGFVDVTSSSGINFKNGFVNALTPEVVGDVAPSGVASGDYDNDGDIDIFIVRGDIGPNLLYRNKGNLVFEEVAAAAGIAFTESATTNHTHSGPMFVDIDGDGDLDLFLGGMDGDPSLIYANNGDGTFSDVTAGSGIDNMQAAYSLSAAFGDYDLDGDLDLFVAHWGTRRDMSEGGDTEHLWRNDTDAGGIKFTSVSESAGIVPSILTLPGPNISLADLPDFTFTPTFARINDDLYPDILSVADFDYSQYFVNNQNGTFTNATDTAVLRDGNGMGSAVADYDNDGDLDWFVSSIKCIGPLESDCQFGTFSRLGNRLYRNDDGVFVDVTDDAGVASGGWGWGACFIDFENDGDLDIYHTNGWSYSDSDNDFKIDTSRAFVADGTGRFTERAAQMGLDDTEEGRGVVCADFDNDGDVDILQLHRSPELAATLWRNDADGNNFLSVKLNGVAPNTEAVGARITITVAGAKQMREISIASNFVSQNPTVQTFGLGSSSQADELSIQWPDGSITVMTNVPAGQFISVNHPDL